ncbi:DUF3293 domain-containing protein [Chitinolyticbacter albus]|uniref:DUF3293 domain-containing protein n=1 Tax=Chitinolyticbacter albus TaxID=2961951 RepID=UPI00210D4BFD|nr:DUF3293 domain-containing protein [Chitinolyticbacter albus]
MTEAELEAQFGAAYRATRYRVPSLGFCIRVGQRHPEVDAELARLGETSWLLISACNPYSAAQLCAHENLARHQNLIDALSAAGFTLVEALGEPDEAGWQSEPSLWVPGFELAAARAWGQRFEQNAVVVGRLGEPVQLVWCR